MKKTSQLFKDLPPTLILDTHYLPEEVVQLRKTLESHGCPVTSSIFHAELVITKLTQEKRTRRELSDLVRKQKGEGDATTKEMVVVKEKWIRKCIEDDKLVDWPFTNSNFFWQIARVEPIQPITPPRRQRSPDKFLVPGEPASKRRTLSRSGSQSASTSARRPFAVSAPSFESASSEDPTSAHFHPASQTSVDMTSGEEDDKFDYRDVYSCRRKSPLISRNETFVKLLVEIKLARELALYIPLFLKLTEGIKLEFVRILAPLPLSKHTLTN
jgi:hypothetical protein